MTTAAEPFEGGVKARPPGSLDLSVIVPVSERPHDLDALYREYAPVLRASAAQYEFMFVMEPWNEPLARALTELRRAGEPIRVLVAGQALGEGGLFRAAVPQARGDKLLVLPAYPRVVAEGLQPLLEAAGQAGAEVVVARRWPRRDSLLNRVQHRAFHVLLQGAVGQTVHDLGCGVRILRREVAEALPLYGDSFRFMPVLAMREGFSVREVEVAQHLADRGPRGYRPGVYARRLLDLLGLFFLARFVEKPLRFFGLVGGGTALVGGMITAVVIIQRLGGRPLADRPLFVLGLLLVMIGVQAIALGLIGEIVVHVNVGGRSPYRLREFEGPSAPEQDG